MGFTEAEAPPHTTCIVNRCARSWRPWSSNAWRMAEFHQRLKVKSYPLLDPDIRPRCMMSVPMCWTGRWLEILQYSNDVPVELQSHTTTDHERWTCSFQIPNWNYPDPEDLGTFISSPVIPISIQTPWTPFTYEKRLNYVLAHRSSKDF